MRLNSANRIHVLPEILNTHSFWFIVGSVISTVYNYNLNLDFLHKQNKKQRYVVAFSFAIFKIQLAKMPVKMSIKNLQKLY